MHTFLNLLGFACFDPDLRQIPIVQGDRREPDVFEMASRRLLCEVAWGTSGSWPRYTMPFQ